MRNLVDDQMLETASNLLQLGTVPPVRRHDCQAVGIVVKIVDRSAPRQQTRCRQQQGGYSQPAPNGGIRHALASPWMETRTLFRDAGQAEVKCRSGELAEVTRRTSSRREGINASTLP
jgi:hypothetical protein